MEREAAFNRGFYYYNQQSYSIYEVRTFSFKQTNAGITHWKSAGIDNYSLNTDLRGIVNTSNTFPKVSILNSRMGVKFSGNYVKENKSIYSLKSVINIYCVYSLDTVSNTRNTDFTAQNCLFGAVKITKDSNTSHYKYEGYGVCMDAKDSFSCGNRIDAKNFIILGAYTTSSTDSNNKKNIYVLGKDFIQGLTTDRTGSTRT